MRALVVFTIATALVTAAHVGELVHSLLSYFTLQP
jgi:hypothetical protein